MANSRTDRVRARLPGERGVQNGRVSVDPAGFARTRRAATEMADGVLAAAGADTARHSREVEQIALRIADHLGLSGEERQEVGIGARLHDIGKVAIPRSLLEKATPPTAQEWELIYSHTVVGERILRSVEELRGIAPSVRHSHERWDGGGYPDGLRGEQIPAASRIIFCADAFHAICSDRPYRSGSSVATALAEIRRCAGSQFEPRVVTALMQAVRSDLYGGPGRVRRRSHARLSTVLVVGLSLCGSIAAGFAAGRDASPEPILSFGPQPALPAAPSFSTATSQLGPDPVPAGGVAGAVESFGPVKAAKRPDRPEPERDPAAREAVPPLPSVPSSAIESVSSVASGIGSRLAPPPDPAKGRPGGKGSVGEPGSSPAPSDPGDAGQEPDGEARQFPGIDAAQPLTHSLKPVGPTSSAPPPRGKRAAQSRERR